MSLEQVKATLVKTPGRSLPLGEYKPAYGTAGYRVHLDPGGVEHCLTRKHKFELVWSGPTLVVNLIKGDAEEVKALVKAEVDHFDCNLTWERQSD